MKKVLLIVLVSTTFVFSLNAQDFSFQATVNKTTINTAENLKLTLTMNNVTGKIQVPQMKDWQVVGGPSTQNSVNIVNGKMTRAYSEVYLLKPLKEGTLTVPEFTAKTDKGTLASKPISVNVVKGTVQPKAPNNAPAPNGNSSESGDFYIDIELNKRKVYVGEPVLATYRFYSIYDPQQIEKADYPKLEGFWSEEIDVGQIDVQTTVINGRRYKTAIVKRQLLFPQVSGKLEIDGYSLQMVVSTGGGFFFRQNQRVQDVAAKTNVDVLPYPQGKPNNLLGTYQPLTLKVTADKTTLKANEAINLKVVFTGTGNMKLIEEIPFEFPSDFEAFEPKIKDNISINASGESGSRSFEYVLIPRLEGDYNIPSINVAYFDSEIKSFRTLESPAFAFHVEKGDGSAAGNYTYDSRTDVQILNQEIRFIKPSTLLSSKSKLFFGSLPYYGIMALPALLFGVILLIRKRKDDEENDLAGTNKKRAGKTVRKQFVNAAALLKQGKHEEFHDELFHALSMYLSHKLNIPLSDLNKQHIQSEVTRLATVNMATEVLTTLQACEMARYAGLSISASNELLDRAEHMVQHLDTALKS